MPPTSANDSAFDDLPLQAARPKKLSGSDDSPYNSAAAFILDDAAAPWYSGPGHGHMELDPTVISPSNVHFIDSEFFNAMLDFSWFAILLIP